MRALWNNIKEKLGFAPKAKEVCRVIAVQGEYEPGILTVDVAMFDEMGDPIPYPTKTIKARIPVKMRPTVNRVLCGLNTPEDEVVVELFILNLKEVKDYQANPRG